MGHFSSGQKCYASEARGETRQEPEHAVVEMVRECRGKRGEW